MFRNVVNFFLLIKVGFNFLYANDLEQRVQNIRDKFNVAVKTYDLYPDDPIDVVIPCCDKDVLTLKDTIQGIRSNGANIRRIIILSSTPFEVDAEWFDEALFPFDKLEIAMEILKIRSLAKRYVKHPKSRIGWIFQQLMKFYAPLIIPEISSNVLVLDADTVFLNKTRFKNDLGEVLFNVGTEFYDPYFKHMPKVLPYLQRIHPDYSGITHHMLFQRSIILDFKKQIEEIHGCPLWKALIQAIDLHEIYSSCCSEFEMYFNFTLLNTDQRHIRPLKWENIPHLDTFELYRKKDFSYVSCHAWLRKLHNSRLQKN